MRFFPLYRSRNVPSMPLSSVQKSAIAEYENKVQSQRYDFYPSRCLCGAEDGKDTTLLLIDRYGIKNPSVVCEECGLVRTKMFFEGKSLGAFYADDYRRIYVGDETASDKFFLEQLARGNRLLGRLKRFLGDVSGKSIFEVGCGAGGILQAFRLAGAVVTGCDFGERYLEYGRSKGLQLHRGEIHEVGILPNSQDVIILMHVFEHFQDPISNLKSIVRYLKPGGFLVVEVPGVFSLAKTYVDPIQYFQSAHAYSYSEGILRGIFTSMGLRVLFGSEECFFVLEKQSDVELSVGRGIADVKSKFRPILVKGYLLVARLLFIFRLNPFLYRHALARWVHRRRMK